MIRSPSQSLVTFAISSAIFFGDKPSGPTFGARDAGLPTVPPVTRTVTNLMNMKYSTVYKLTWMTDGSAFGGMSF